MERWSGRVALVTGASAGIGEAITKELVKRGLKVVGVARRVEKIEALQKELNKEPGRLYPFKMDVSNEEDIIKTFDWVKKNLGGVDILINNAGASSLTLLTDASSEIFHKTFNLNVIGLSLCTREAIKSMKERGVDDGHIININSLGGHYIRNFPGIYPYNASKFAVTVLTEGLRRELVQQKSKIRVTSLSPGLVKTEMYDKALEEVPALQTMEDKALSPENIADAVVYVLGTPPHVQVHELMLRHVEYPN